VVFFGGGGGGVGGGGGGGGGGGNDCGCDSGKSRLFGIIRFNITEELFKRLEVEAHRCFGAAASAAAAAAAVSVDVSFCFSSFAVSFLLFLLF
jgi:hypothetical protein